MSFLKPDPPSAPSPSDTADAQIRALQAAINANRQATAINSSGPFGSTTWDEPTTGAWTQTSTMDPQAENIIRQNMAQQNSQIQAGAQAMNDVDRNATLGFHPDGSIPSLVGGVAPTPVKLGYSRAGETAIPGASDFGGAEKGMEDALYSKATSRLDPQWQVAQTAQETKLRNQGLQPGDEAYDNAMRDFNNAKTDAYNQATYGAVSGGTAAQSQQIADALRVRMQQGGEQQQDLSNVNTGEQQKFGQELTSAQEQNAARGQGFGEQQTEYQMPLTYYNGIVRGNTPAVPGTSTPATMPVSGAGAPDMATLIGQQYNGQMNRYNAQMAPWNDLLSIGGMAAGSMLSSKALKEKLADVDPAKMLAAAKALPLIAFRYHSDDRVHIGTFAEEFKAATGFGDGVSINVLDAFGTLLACVKALAHELDELKEGLRLGDALAR